MSNNPKYAHDSDCCRYHGTIVVNDSVKDVYSCIEEDGDCRIIIRHSSKDSDYSCLPRRIVERFYSDADGVGEIYNEALKVIVFNEYLEAKGIV